MFTDDQVTAGGSVVTSLQIKSECDAVGKVDHNEVVGKTNPIISATSDTSACTYSSKGSGSYISAPASLESDADTNKNENDSPLEEITTVTFHLFSVSPIFTIGCKGNPDSYNSKSYGHRNSSMSSSSSSSGGGGILINKNHENTTGSRYCRGTGKFLKGRIVPPTTVITTAAAATTPIMTITTFTPTSSTSISAAGSGSNVPDREMMITNNNTTISAYQSESSSNSTSTSTFAIPYGIKVEDNMESRTKGISLCTSFAPVHSNYSCPLSVASEATQKVHLNAKFQ